ncbi:MAG: ABC transporter ATP-binding protein [Betaproteobacteria bacterium RBG_19FT_COMBO_58_11]|nr:MAG: ABC transporter ATP-binding protein [Betaproteobacteria bacterium RBG_19FT_COMBO_58_11]
MSEAALPSLLEARNLTVAYGGIQAVKEASFEINEGELVCFIGANGAGKSSLLKSLCGLVPAAHGAIHFQNQSITHLPVHEIVRRGIALVPEGRGIFSRMTVKENLEMGAYTRNDQSINADMEKSFALFPRLKERLKQQAGTLSGGEQQMLAIARALMGRPKLLLLDEPSMGLAPLMVQKIFETIRDVSKAGMTILLVEQNAKLALAVSHRGYVMESGAITLSDAAAALAANPEVRRAYLGE